MTRHVVAALAALAATAAALPATALAQQAEIEAEGPVIALTIFEEVTAEPDLVTIGAGVSTEAPTAVEAMRENARQMTRVIDRIKSLGVAEKDIQTSGINLNAQYDYQRNERPVFRGYQVSNRVSVKLRELDETGEVLDALVVAGATDLSGPSFSLEDDTAAKAQARERAIARAQERAMSYARGFGYSGVRVLSVSETIQGSGPTPPMMARDESAIIVTGASRAPVQPGLVGTGVSITVQYEMTGGPVG
ncbi:SIMPL domain-containing protein [Erythrobacter sp.]|jgi:uncharacterized protein YggE|uniref:SIMPL domain-containing protein n=1 Tax=Erythrobacter sp. TaxID=1042 RepID=UPI002EBE63B4|nr:SIMPL domain-containing protein [Erythrobacter sp.]